MLEALADKVISKGRADKFLFNPKGEISMSDAISQIIAPYIIVDKGI